MTLNEFLKNTSLSEKEITTRLNQGQIKLNCAPCASSRINLPEGVIINAEELLHSIIGRYPILGAIINIIGFENIFDKTGEHSSLETIKCLESCHLLEISKRNKYVIIPYDNPLINML
jgi:hypothetical protein